MELKIIRCNFVTYNLQKKKTPMRIRLTWSICCLLPFLLLACQSPKESTPGEEPNTETSVEPQEISVNAQLICRDISKDDIMPQFEIALNLNNRMHLLDTITSCSPFTPEEYERYEIPAEAVSAAGGWFAGAGDYFYATVVGNVCTVMYGWQDEQQEDEGFHYEQVRRFVVNAQ
jgi:hypothetical protein